MSQTATSTSAPAAAATGPLVFRLGNVAGTTVTMEESCIGELCSSKWFMQASGRRCWRAMGSIRAAYEDRGGVKDKIKEYLVDNAEPLPELAWSLYMVGYFKSVAKPTIVFHNGRRSEMRSRARRLIRASAFMQKDYPQWRVLSMPFPPDFGPTRFYSSETPLSTSTALPTAMQQINDPSVAQGLRKGAIAAIITGLVFAIMTFILGLWMFLKRRNRKMNIRLPAVEMRPPEDRSQPRAALSDTVDHDASLREAPASSHDTRSSFENPVTEPHSPIIEAPTISYETPSPFENLATEPDSPIRKLTVQPPYNSFRQHVFYSGELKPNGLRIATTGRDAKLREATAGGLLFCGDTFYLLTVNHIFIEQDSANSAETGNIEGWDDFDTDLEADIPAATTTSLGGVTFRDIDHDPTPSVRADGEKSRAFVDEDRPVDGREDKAVTSVRTSVDDTHNMRRVTGEPQSSQRRETGFPIVGRQRSASRPAKTLPSTNVEGWFELGSSVFSSAKADEQGHTDSLDYALILPSMRHSQDLRTTFFPRILPTQRAAIAAQGPCDTDVVTFTGSRGRLNGQLSGVSTTRIIDENQTFQDNWTVRFWDKIGQGDSGSWVHDALSQVFYGHIIAGDSDGKQAYIMPAIDVLKDIHTRFSPEVTPGSLVFNDQEALVRWSNVPRLHQHYHPSVHSASRQPQVFEDSFPNPTLNTSISYSQMDRIPRRYLDQSPAYGEVDRKRSASERQSVQSSPWSLLSDRLLR